MLSLLPALAALIAMLIFIKYPLNDEKFKQIRNETEARKLAAIEAQQKPEDVLVPGNAV
jgi:Na+/melibiose symporter-like transporter